jgi:Glycosyl transferase family 2
VTDPLITVVVATYGRPDALAAALESVRRQRFADWTALVVGDCCPPGTADEVVASFGDGRFAFVNLPERQGDQSQPNSVGAQLADTTYVAFLNHDDLWLPDHLDRAVTVLDHGDVDFYASSAAFTWDVRETAQGHRPVFSDRTPLQRRLSDCYWANRVVFEPVSCWVLTRALVRDVGPWARGSDLHRVPLQDWVLRAWRHGARFHHESAITTLKINTQYRLATGHLYGHGADDQLALLRLIDDCDPAELTDLVDADLREAKTLGLRPPRDVWMAFGSDPDGVALTKRLKESMRQFLQTGHDVWEDIESERGSAPGRLMESLLLRRTGETQTSSTPLNELVDHARAQLPGS